MAKKEVSEKWLPSSRSRRVNVIGFMRADKVLNEDSVYAYEIEGSIDATVVVACFDALAARINRETWVIIDNAPQHTSKLFRSKLKAWSEIGLHIKYLPPYSPELNKIEILWRFMKYSWLQIKLGWNYSDLKHNIGEVLVGIGGKYKINFS